MAFSSAAVPRSFSETWTLEDTRVIFESHKASPSTSGKEYDIWRDNYQKLCSHLFEAVGEHVAYLARTQRVTRIDPMGLNLPWVNAWNRLVENKNKNVTEWDRQSAVRPFHGVITRPFYMSSPSLTAEEIHEKLQSEVRLGTWNWFSLASVQDSNYGVNVFPEVHAWSVTLGRMTKENGTGRADFEPYTTPLPPHGIISLQIDVPSGELMVADWFDIPALNKAIRTRVEERMAESLDHYQRNSTTLEGCERRTQIYASLGFVRVNVGDTCINLFAESGCLMMGSMPEKNYSSSEQTPADLFSPTPLCLGSISSDSTWLTAADKTTVLHVLEQEMGVEAAQYVLDEFIASEPYGLNILKVPPGTYHLYTAANPEVFKKSFAAEEVDLSSFREIMGVLTSSPLRMIPINKETFPNASRRLKS